MLDEEPEATNFSLVEAYRDNIWLQLFNAEFIFLHDNALHSPRGTSEFVMTVMTVSSAKYNRDNLSISETELAKQADSLDVLGALLQIFQIWITVSQITLA